MSMTSSKLRAQCGVVRVPHSWHEAYASALRESDPDKLIGRIEYAINAIERRYSEWTNAPGTPAELAAIQRCICALKRRMKEEQLCGQRRVFQRHPGESPATLSLHVRPHI